MSVQHFYGVHTTPKGIHLKAHMVFSILVHFSYPLAYYREKHPNYNFTQAFDATMYTFTGIQRGTWMY